MKTSFSIYLISLLYNLYAVVSLTAQSPATPLGQQVTPVNPAFEAPAIVTSKFNTEYPNSMATWSKTGDYFAAEFPDKTTQTKKVVVYDSFGNLQYSRSELPLS